MPTWNMFSAEVNAERTKIRNYGSRKELENFPGMRTDSYKAQALRELAARLEAEEIIKNLKASEAKLIDRVEDLELRLDLLRSDANKSVPLAERVQLLIKPVSLDGKMAILRGLLDGSVEVVDVAENRAVKFDWEDVRRIIHSQGGNFTS